MGDDGSVPVVRRRGRPRKDARKKDVPLELSERGLAFRGEVGKKDRIGRRASLSNVSYRAMVQMRAERIFKELAEGKTQREAGIAAGYSPTCAQQQVSAMLKRPSLKKLFVKLLHKACPDEYHVAKYKELMEAKRPVVVKSKIVHVPDAAVQLRCADSIAKLKNYLVDEPAVVNITEIPIKFV